MMFSMKIYGALLVLLFLLCGCSPWRYSEYTGQKRIWTTSFEAIAETGHDVPVYRSWPERDYRVIGSLRFEDRNQYWNGDIIAKAADEAEDRGGDAIIIRRGSEFGVSKIIGAEDSDSVYWSGQTTALVIQWLTEEEVQRLDRLKQKMAKEFLRSHQNVRPNMDVFELAFRFAIQQGENPGTSDFDQRTSSVLASLIGNAPGTLSGNWLFKVTFSTSTMTTKDADSFLGLARIRQTDDTITVISEEGPIELNFNGTSSSGGLKGRIGIERFSADATGATFPDKISLSFSSRTPNGVVGGNVVFQRLINQPKQSPYEEAPSRTPTRS